MTRARTLKLADNLTLPIDAVTEPIGMFANRGKGKSNAAHRFVEQLYHAGLPSVVLDVKGDWYGIRSSADGRSAGLPFLIVGGSHGDVPLEAGSGAQWARLVAEQRIPTIFDLSHFSKTQARKWAMEFAEELYRVNTEPLMVVVDEADVLIPQRLAAELMRLLGAMEDIAKRGRQRGLGILIISQRVADVNKSVTDLLETLFLFAVTGSRTRKALLEWIDDHADPEEAKAVIATLSSMDPGDCWVWSPGWLKLLERFVWLRPETFDSHATPKAGQAPRAIKTMAELDLSAIKEQMADTIERAQADDPKELRRRINQLERELRAARKAPPEPAVERVDVPVVDEATLRRLEQLTERYDKAAADAVTKLGGLLNPVVDGLEELCVRARAIADAPRITRPPAASTPRGTAPRRAAAPAPARTAVATLPAGDMPLKAGARRMVEVLGRFHPRPLTRTQVSTLADVKQGGTFSDYLRAAVQAGLVDEDRGLLALTELGVASVDCDGRGMSTEEILAIWRPKLKAGARRMLDLLVDRYPDGLTRSELSDMADVKAGGTFSDYLRSLTKNGLADERDGVVVAGETLFLG